MASSGEGLASPELEIAEGGAIVDPKTRFADLKAMLDSSKDNLKMDAMKRIINLVAKGRDVAELFPAVVKNVAAKNLELKKLVFVYLVRYAEEQQDLALLSISTFQRALKDPNQLIRASALRVLSSIRVPMIAPIMLLAIRESVRDMSAYVRKVAAHAIPKLYSLEESLQPELIECIDYLLGDKRTLVLGSAVYAFEETCPDRFDLLHRHYRSLCKAITDVDEWGQVVMIGLLTRYARSQFTAPTNGVDPDLCLLLSSCRPLLQSRNCAVVMAVAQLFYHCAPPSQPPIIAKALVRLLRGPREVQSAVLVSIATICATNSNMFEPFLKSFFVRPAEPKHIKLMKLQVLTSLVSETNVQLVLRELQTYVGMAELADAAVEAIGQCAARVPSVADACLSGLVSLIASSNENIVSAAVVVLKRLLHINPPLPLLNKVIRLIESVKAPQARACVVWLVATHVDKVASQAPAVLQVMAKYFTHEESMVKLQTMNLAVKLWLRQREECELLVKYVMQLARFDQSYDVRDRCRFLRAFMNEDNRLAAFANEIFNAEKPSPTLQSSFKDREQFQLGSLSHYLNQRCTHYRDLPQFPEVAPDASVRSVQPIAAANGGEKMTHENVEDENDFYSEEEDEESEEEEDEELDESDEENEDEEDEEEQSSTGDEEEGQNEVRNQILQPHLAGDRMPATRSANLDLDLLLDLKFESDVSAALNVVAPKYVTSNYNPLLSHAAWPIGISVGLCFARETSPLSSSMCTIMLKFTNHLTEKSPMIKFLPKEAGTNQTSGEFEIESISPEESVIKKIFVDFGDSKRAVQWNLQADGASSVSISIEAPMGEQIEPITMTEEQFINSVLKLTGMNEHSGKLVKPFKSEELYMIANCTNVTGSEVHYCAQTLSRKQPVLIAFEREWVHVHCENIVLGSLLCNEITNKFSSEQ